MLPDGAGDESAMAWNSSTSPKGPVMPSSRAGRNPKRP